MSCRKCRWMDVQPNKAGRISPRKDTVYPCIVPVEMPVLPYSITSRHDFSAQMFDQHNRRYVSPNEGDNCPMFERRS